MKSLTPFAIPRGRVRGRRIFKRSQADSGMLSKPWPVTKTINASTPAMVTAWRAAASFFLIHARVKARKDGMQANVMMTSVTRRRVGRNHHDSKKAKFKNGFTFSFVCSCIVLLALENSANVFVFGICIFNCFIIIFLVLHLLLGGKLFEAKPSSLSSPAVSVSKQCICTILL